MNTRTRTLALILSVGIACAAALPVAARDPSPTIPMSALTDRGGEGRAFSINGRIDSVDYTSNLIVVRSKGSTVTIALTPTTSVDLNGQPGSIADLRKGAHVKVRGSMRGGAMIAETIFVH